MAAIEVPAPSGEPVVVDWGRRHGEPIGVPLVYHGVQVGRLLVTMRTVGGVLSQVDRRLLDDCGAHRQRDRAVRQAAAAP